ncbi:MAG: MFS transporter, partial [Dehalococcoidia bacterium]|nr:MFS transporter [Dehalococcoidia bacterium]
GVTWTVPTSTVLRWFKKRQGFALGIVTAGVGFGALIFAPLLNYLIQSYGWRQTFLITGILSFGIVAFSSAFFIYSPEKLGLKPYGESLTGQKRVTENWTTRDAVRMLPFWSLIVMASIGAFGFNAISVHLIPYTTDMGILSTAAAAAQGLIGGFSILGRLGIGFIAERWGWKAGLVMAFTATCASTVWLLLLSNLPMLYAFTFVFGVAHGLRMPSQTGIMGTYFGTRSAGELIGILNAIGTGVGAMGPYFAGLVFDRNGSYVPALYVIVLVYVVSVFLALKFRPQLGFVSSGSQG